MSHFSYSFLFALYFFFVSDNRHSLLEQYKLFKKNNGNKVLSVYTVRTCSMWQYKLFSTIVCKGRHECYQRNLKLCHIESERSGSWISIFKKLSRTFWHYSSIDPASFQNPIIYVFYKQSPFLKHIWRNTSF